MNKLFGMMLIGLGLACAANAAIIKDDVIYVDFGEDFSGSASNGHRDQILALRWVRDNIADYGGDIAPQVE